MHDRGGKQEKRREKARGNREKWRNWELLLGVFLLPSCLALLLLLFFPFFFVCRTITPPLFLCLPARLSLSLSLSLSLFIFLSFPLFPSFSLTTFLRYTMQRTRFTAGTLCDPGQTQLTITQSGSVRRSWDKKNSMCKKKKMEGKKIRLL